MLANSEWMLEAKCRGRLGEFFSKRISKQVRETCQQCPAAKECAEYAVVNEVYGFWGGTTEAERKAERRRRGIPEPQFNLLFVAPKPRENVEETIEHGTTRGYKTHQRHSVPFVDQNGLPCTCKQANADYIREYRKKKVEV